MKYIYLFVIISTDCDKHNLSIISKNYNDHSPPGMDTTNVWI